MLLSPEVLRRVACDAALIPHVLGTAGEELDLGRVVRLFTRAQRRPLWRRDRTLHLPGVHQPGVVDAGASCAALGRWWGLRHRQRGLVVPATTTRSCTPDGCGPGCAAHRTSWAGTSCGTCTPGSYDRQLEWLARQRAEHDPPPLTEERLLELVAALTGSEEADRRLAEHDLALIADEQYCAAGPRH